MSPLKRNIRRGRTEHTVTLGPARLYLDDLEELWTAVQSLKADKGGPLPDWECNLQIRAGDAQADEIEDLAKASPKELRQVVLSNFRSGNPIRVRLGRASAYVAVESDDAEAVKLADEIKHYVDQRRRLSVGFMAHPEYTWIGLFGLVGLAFAIVSAVKSGDVASVITVWARAAGAGPLLRSKSATRQANRFGASNWAP